MSTWTLYVTDQLGARVAQIDTYHSFRLIGRHNAISTWELALPRDSGGADALLTVEHPRVQLRIDGTTLESGPVTRFARTQSGADDDLTVHGVDDTAWLARRVAHPTPGKAAPPYNTTAYDTRAGNAAQVLAQYVDVNAGPGAVAARRVPGLTVPVPAPAGAAVNLSARYENLLDFVAGAANAAGLGFRVVDLSLQVFSPVLRSAVFAVDLGTLAETESIAESPEANFVYVAGQGEGTARTIVEVSDAASVTGWGRVETFQDRRDTNDPALLAFAGNETLARAVIPPTVAMVPLQRPGQQFPTDWNLSDRVTIRIGTQTRIDLVREVEVRLEGGDPVSITARIGTAGDLAMFRAGVNTARRVRQLERV